MAQISELLKALQQGNGGFTQPQSPFQLDAPTPAAPPTVGPTLANAAALPQAPAPEREGFMARLGNMFTSPRPQGGIPTSGAGILDPLLAEPLSAEESGGGGFTERLGGMFASPQPFAIPNTLATQNAETKVDGGSLFQSESGGLSSFAAGGEYAKPAPTQFGLADPTSSTAPTGEDPFSAPIVQPQARPQADPNQQISLADPASSTEGLSGTQAYLQERFGAPTISAIQAAPEGLGMRTDPQGRMIDPNVDRSDFEKESAAREARMDQRSDFGTAVSDRDRRAARGECMSMADATAMTGGDRDKARAMVVASRQDAWQKPMTRAEELAERKFQAGLAENNRAWETAQADKAAEAAAGVQETAQARQKTVERMDSQLSFLKNSAVEMAGLQDWSTEGFTGWVAEKLPLDTAAAQVNRLATSFQGNAFLRSIIDSKSLGATFGALSDNEGNKITAAETTLMDPKMGNEARMRAAKQIIDTIESAKSRAMKEQSGGGESTNAPRYSDDQDDGVKVETYYQG